MNRRQMLMAGTAIAAETVTAPCSRAQTPAAPAPTLATAGAGAGSGPGKTAAELRWAVATGYRAEGYHARNLQQLGQALHAATSGAFGLEVRADNTLVPLPAIPDAVASGRPPLGEVIMTGLSKRWPVCGADAVPFFTTSLADARHLWDVQRPVVERALAPAGLGVLLAVPWPGQGLYSRQPVARADDLKGQRMRVYNPTTQRIAELLGATPVDVPMAQVGQALAEGRIDCMITSAVTGVEQQAWRWMSHFYDLNAWMPKNLVLVHQPSLEALPAAHRQTLLQLARQAEQRGWAACEQAGREAIATLQANKLPTEATPPLLLPTLRRLGERFSREWVHDVGPEANTIFVPYYTRSPRISAEPHKS